MAQTSWLSEELSGGTWRSPGPSPPENDTGLLVPSSVQPLGGLLFVGLLLIRRAEIVSISFSKMMM